MRIVYLLHNRIYTAYTVLSSKKTILLQTQEIHIEDIDDSLTIYSDYIHPTRRNVKVMKIKNSGKEDDEVAGDNGETNNRYCRREI